MKFFKYSRTIWIFIVLLLVSSPCLADDDLFNNARTLQRSGNYDDAIGAYKDYLCRPMTESNMADEQLAMYTDALVQMMNTFQSKGQPEACISTLQEVFESSPTLQNECLRDYYSVLGYALSRTENMHQAEETTLKALTLPLHRATPERYFRDYAYAAAVFYSNPDYQKEVVNWCQEALVQAQSCKNTSGQQWVMSMLGSLYKRNGDLNGALELFQQSIVESRSREDELGVLNSLSALVDLFLYWNIPEYADMYASEAVAVEKKMTRNNPMISAQTYINKGRALHQLGDTDSISFYLDYAREFCGELPYNSGMVDVDLLSGTCMTEIGGEHLQQGIEELLAVVEKGTAANRAKAYHQLARTYPRNLQVAIGTSFQELLMAVGYSVTPYKILSGGPMMGVTQFDSSVPVIKGVNCVTILGEQNRFAVKVPHCIRCGKCIDACPMHLMPVLMYNAERNQDVEEMKAQNLLDCIECGCCAYTCPATIPLVQLFRAGKQRIRDAAAPKKS